MSQYPLYVTSSLSLLARNVTQGGGLMISRCDILKYVINNRGDVFRKSCSKFKTKEQKYQELYITNGAILILFKCYVNVNTV